MYYIAYNQFGDIRHLTFDIPDKVVTCYRCRFEYNLKDAPLIIPESGRVKEPACPNCNCKLYLS